MARTDEENKTFELAIHYWGPFKSGKSTSVAYIRSRLMKTDFEVDDDPFISSEKAARQALPMAIMGGFWRTPPLSKLNDWDLHVHFRDASGFPAGVPLKGPFAHALHRLTEADLGRDAIDAIIFVASSAKEDLEANRTSLDELVTRGLVERTVFQLNKQDVRSALAPEKLVAKLGIEGRPWFPSVARTGEGVFKAFQEAVKIGLGRHAEK